MKSSSQKRTSTYKNQKTSVRISSRKNTIRDSSRKNSSKKPISELHLFTKDSSCTWKSRKKKSVHSKGSDLMENESWKCRKKKRSLLASLEFMHVRKGPSLRRNLAWKRKKKSRRTKKFLYYNYDWSPDIDSLLKTGESSCFPAGSVRTHGLQEFNGLQHHTTLILLLLNVMPIIMSMSFN